MKTKFGKIFLMSALAAAAGLAAAVEPSSSSLPQAAMSGHAAMRNEIRTFSAASTLASPPVSSAGMHPADVRAKKEMKARLNNAIAAFPMSFERNDGQMDPQVKFLSRGKGYALFLTATGSVLSLHREGEPGNKNRASALHMKLEGANRNPRVTGIEELPGKINYFTGNDPKKWRPNIPSYAKVRYANIYPGVDLVFYGNKERLEYDFIVGSGAKPDSIILAFKGMCSLKLSDEGALVLELAEGSIQLNKPVLYQEVNGIRKSVDGGFKIAGRNRVRFSVGKYDSALPLVIDPILLYSSYLGGSDYDAAQAIALGADNQVYVTGWTLSADFPGASTGYSPRIAGSADIFVSRIDVKYQVLIYSTYLGGTNVDRGTGIAVDSGGNAYVTGFTSSRNYPTVHPFQGSPGGLPGDKDAILSILDPSGSSLLYSTYWGGNGEDQANAIALDAQGNIYIAGYTDSSTFPVSPGYQLSQVGGLDAFVTKFDKTGIHQIYSTYLGGSGADMAEGIAVDSDGNAYVVGSTSSSDFPFPAIRTGFQQRLAGGLDCFIVKLDPTGTNLIYTDYLGGSNDDEATSVAIDSSRNVYVAGNTISSDFPVVKAVQSSLKGASDAFVAKINPAGDALIFSTYLGGSGAETLYSMAVDPAGEPYVTGCTNSLDFPIKSAIQSSLGGSNDAFVARFDSTGLLIYSTYLGGSDDDRGRAIAVDSSFNAFIAGSTQSTNFPTKNPIQAENAWLMDAFLTRLSAHIAFYAPRLMTRAQTAGTQLDTSEYTGFALVNLGPTDGLLTFTAYNTSGALISGPGISNPATMDIPAQSQIAAIDTQLFGSSLPSLQPVGWVKVESAVGKIVGSTYEFNSSLSALDGAQLIRLPKTSFVFSEIDSQGNNQFHVVNPNSQSANVTFSLYAPDGTTVAAGVARTVAPGGALVESFSTLFPGKPADESYYILGTANIGVVAFEYMVKPGIYATALNGLDVSASSKSLCAPQYYSVGNYATTLSIINVDSTDSTLSLELYQDDGTITAYKSVTIPAHGKFHLSDPRYFTGTSAFPEQGYVLISVTGGRVLGSAVFRDSAHNVFAAALPLMSASSAPAAISQVASDSHYYTGIAMVNRSATADVNVLLQLFDANGTLLDTAYVALGATKRVCQLLDQIFTNIAGQQISGGYVEITPSGPISSFVIIGTNDLTSLSAVENLIIP